MDPLEALERINNLLGQISLTRDGHVKLQQDVALIKSALQPSLPRGAEE